MSLEEKLIHNRFVFSRKPVMIYWEMTQACDLACKHCRAEAIPDRHPLELTTDEGKKLLSQLREFGDPSPHLVMTGGDALKRPDLFELIEYGVSIGLKISVAPSATNHLTPDVIKRFKDLGVLSLSLSLDGSTKEKHDEFRGVDGVYDMTIRAAEEIKKAGIPLQVNTLVSKETYDDIPAIFEVVKDFAVVRWSLFFLIQVGRGKVLNQITPEEAENLLIWLYEKSKEVKFAIATTEAPHYRRVAFERMIKSGMSIEEILKTPIGRGFGIRDGNGVMFISHIGDIYPSGFLPITAGNVRKDHPVEVYRNSKIFRRLRDYNELKGKCGRCEYRAICGGARSRAFAATGDPFESDPLCEYEP